MEKNLNISYIYITYIFKNRKFITSSYTLRFSIIHYLFTQYNALIFHFADNFILHTIMDRYVYYLLHNLSLFVSLSTAYDEATSDIVYMHRATSLSIQIKFTFEYALSRISLCTRFTCHIYIYFFKILLSFPWQLVW